eukprot:485434-Hanusia_phi.AAC.1
MATLLLYRDYYDRETVRLTVIQESDRDLVTTREKFKFTCAPTGAYSDPGRALAARGLAESETQAAAAAALLAADSAAAAGRARSDSPVVL